MKNFTPTAPRVYLGLLLKVIICLLWLLCIVSAARALPTISQHPGNKSVCSGTNPTFIVGGISNTSGAVSFKWQESINNGAFADINDGADYSGTTTLTLTLPNVSSTFNSRAYRCMVKDNTGSTPSFAGALAVSAPPNVLFDPKGNSVCVGAQIPHGVTFVANSSYQWQLSTNNGASWSNVSDADGYTGSTTNNILYPPVTLAMDNHWYRYIITDVTSGCSNTSAVMDTIHAFPMPVLANADVGPLTTPVCPGDNISFADSATGAAAISYKWQIKQSNVATFTDIVDNAMFSGSQGKYLRITGFNGAPNTTWHVQLNVSYPPQYQGCSLNSSISGIFVRVLPSVALQPADVATCANSDTAFRVTGAGSSLLSYQWATDNGSAGTSWANVGISSSKLSVKNITMAMNGWKYRVTISNACSPPAISNAVTLTVRRSGTWLGAKDTAWQEPMNWCGGVPDNTIDVLVPNWPTKMPLISDGTGTAFFKSLEIENAARLTISGGTINNMTGPFNLLGTVAYTATRDQEILPANHGSLEINGSGNKLLSSNVDVSHNLVLGGSAKLVTRTNYLTMKTGSNPVVASALNASANSWIVTGNGNAGAGNTGIGGLRIEQIDATDGAVLYPIGPTPTAYNPIRLTNTGTVDNFTVAVNDQLIPGGIFDAGISRTWLVAETTPGSSNVSLAVKWLLGEEHTAFDRAQTQIIRSNGIQIVQSTTSTAADPAGGGAFTSANGAFSILTQFSVASTVIVLPVELKSFTAQKTVNAAVGLTWTTPGNETAKYFNVQRSTDGIRFATIGRVNGETGKTGYNYIDNLPGTGVIYYRLQVASQQDEMVYSGIQSLILNSANLMQLRPSVTTGTITNVYVQTPVKTVVSLSITDISGRIHGSQSLQLTKGENLLPLWIGGLNKGVYYVHVKDANGNASVLPLVKN
jgi:hypothetical protein